MQEVIKDDFEFVQGLSEVNESIKQDQVMIDEKQDHHSDIKSVKMQQEIVRDQQIKDRNDVQEEYEEQFQLQEEFQPEEILQVQVKDLNSIEEIDISARKPQDQGNFQTKQQKIEIASLENFDQESLRRQISQMQQKVEEMLGLINQKSKMLAENTLNQEIPAQIYESSELTLLQSIIENNLKTQKIYRSELNSLIRKQSELELKTSQYLSKSIAGQSTLSSHHPSSIASQVQGQNNHDKQLVELIDEEILKIKGCILDTEKNNFTQKKTIKMFENLIQKQFNNSSVLSVSNTSGSINSKTGSSKNPIIQLGQSINIKKKLEEKLTQKLGKLQIQFNASFIKSEEANDHLNSLLSQFPEFQQPKNLNPINQNEQEMLRITSRRTTLQKWSAKSNESILNKNLYEMLKKRKEKAIKGKQLLKKQFQHQEKQLQRDIKGLKTLIHQKSQGTNQLTAKNQYLEEKINLSQIQAIELKKSKEKRSVIFEKQPQKPENPKDSQRKELNIVQTALIPQKPSLKVNLNLDQIISRGSQSLQQNSINVENIKSRKIVTSEPISDSVVQISLICSDNQQPQQKTETSERLKNLEKDIKHLGSHQSLSEQKSSLNQSMSPLTPAKNEEEGNNFRITRPKFPKLTKNSKSLNHSNVSMTPENEYKREYQSTPVVQKSQNNEKFSSPKLLKPFFNSKSVEKKKDTPKIQEPIEKSTFRPKTPIKKTSNLQRPVFFQQSHLETPIVQPARKQSEGQLTNFNKEQQMMNVLRQSIMRVTSSSKKKKNSLQKQSKQKQGNQTDNQKTLRNLLNQNLSMIRNESFIDSDVRKMKKYQNVEPRYNKIDKKQIEIENEETSKLAILDIVKTPRTKKRPQLSNSIQKSTQKLKSAYFDQTKSKSIIQSPKKIQKNEEQSLISQEMQKVKNQIESTILKIKSIEEKIEKESTFNNKNIRTGFYRTRMAVKQREISFDELSETVQIDQRQEVSSNES